MNADIEPVIDIKIKGQKDLKISNLGIGKIEESVLFEGPYYGAQLVGPNSSKFSIVDRLEPLRAQKPELNEFSIISTCGLYTLIAEQRGALILHYKYGEPDQISHKL